MPKVVASGATNGRHAVGVIMTPSNAGGMDPFYSQLLAGISGAVADADLRLELMMPRNRREREDAESYLLSGAAEGAILVGLHVDDPLPEHLVREGIPVAYVGPPPRGVAIDYVDCENRDGGRKATQHLVAIGRKRIATIGGLLDAGGGMERMLGYRDALVEAGYEPDATLEEVADFRPDRATIAMERLLLNHPDVDAVFVASDIMAAMAIRTLQQYRRKVPDDVAVVGFDDSFIAMIAHPTLTTMRQPIPEMAAEAVRLLVSRLGGVAAEPSAVLYPAELVVRESTGGLRVL